MYLETTMFNYYFDSERDAHADTVSMNDPSVSHMQMPLREVKAIRLIISDEIEGMTPAEITAYYNNSFAEIQKKYNFNITTVASAK